MPNNIFEMYAPIYWKSGLPVIPLRQKNKMPNINAWSTYGTRMPDATEQSDWLHSFPKGNIGLPLGAASGLCIIDIDTEDEDLISAIREICGPTPWVRVGKKGMALAYKWEGQKNFKLRGADGGMLCEFLGQGNQVVVPPSIHPDTQKPYEANSNLWEVLDQIPTLGGDIEAKLRSLLGAKGFALGAGGRSAPIDIVPAGERDVQMIRHAGYLARVVLGIDRSASFSLYEAILHMHTWVEHFTANVCGDAMDPNKGVAKLLEFLIKDLEKGRTLGKGWDSDLPNDWREHPTVVQIMALNEGGRWDFQRARDHFDRAIMADISDNAAIAAVEDVIRRVARDPKFSEADQTALIGHMLRHTRKLGFDKPQMRRLITKARKSLESEETETHASIAAEVLEQLQISGPIRYDHGQFWQWSGSCFTPLDDQAIYMHVAQNVKDSPLVRRSSDYKAIVEVLERMCKAPLVEVEVPGVNFANGFVGADLSLAPHDPRYGATFTLPFEYHRANASRCNRWFEFLHSCWEREADFEQRVLALQEMFAATLFGISTDYQRAYLLFGRAETGKTQVLKVLRTLLPPGAVAELGPQHWGLQFHLVDLIGKTANICGELPENGMITGNIFKEVIEGSPVRDSFKNQDGFTFSPKAAHWFASNYLPVSRDTTRGFIRRWLILDFNHPVRAEDRVENLAEIIVAEERDAIAAWALEGLPRLLSQGYTLPPCHDFRVGQMRRINNSVHAFLEDTRLYVKGEGSVKCRDLYDSYAFHMRDVGRGQPVSFERFMQMLEDLEFSLAQDMLGEFIVSGLTKTARAAA